MWADVLLCGADNHHYVKAGPVTLTSLSKAPFPWFGGKRDAAPTVWRWAADGTLAAAVVLPSGQRRFRRSDVEALIYPKAAS